MDVPALISEAKVKQNVPPFVEGDVVRYAGANSRTFLVAHCYPRTLNGETRWIVEERNADSHDPAELELLRRSVVDNSAMPPVPSR